MPTTPSPSTLAAPAREGSRGADAPLRAGFDPTSLRFALAWLLPLSVAAAAAVSAWAAWAAVLGWQVLLALFERVRALRHSPPAVQMSGWHRWCVRLHVPLQAGLVAWAVWMLSGGSSAGTPGVGEVIALGLAVGGVTGSQGITFAHELGHSRSRVDRTLAWLLMTSVLYAHFMVEHYRGHHPRAATPEDPASARRGETLWRFLPRTLWGSWASAWRLEAAQRRQLQRRWGTSPLVWATAAQGCGLVALALWLGPLVLLFWAPQAA